MKILIHRSGQQYGPYSLEQAREYLAAGSLVETDLAWYDGATAWMPLGQITNLAPAVFEPTPEAPAWVPARRDGTSAARAPVSSAPWGTPPSSAPQLTPIPVHTPAAASNVNPFARAPLAAAAEPLPAPISDDPDDLPRIKPKETRINRQLREKQIAGKVVMMVGALVFIGGIIVTFGSMWAAESRVQGGSYFAAWGAILFGALGFIQGLRLYRNE